MIQRIARFECLVCHELGLKIQSLKLVGPCGHLFCARCIARFNATRDPPDLFPLCLFCRNPHTFLVPRAVRAEPVLLEDEHYALVAALKARIAGLRSEVNNQHYLINRLKEDTRAETEEKRVLIRDWQHLCQRASGSTSKDASSSGAGR
ncbi:hypothetical protein FRC12_000656 [Ceratobasidium sp. 428]|nr:hypothetical protein FRC12_000656 [Ceratobasidium sp. 428]